MRIEHVAIWANDLGAEKYYVRFAAQARSLPQRTNRFRSYFLTFDSGARLEIEQPDGGRCGGRRRASAMPMAFSVGSMDEVDALTERSGRRIFRRQRAPHHR